MANHLFMLAWLWDEALIALSVIDEVQVKLLAAGLVASQKLFSSFKFNPKFWIILYKEN